MVTRKKMGILLLVVLMTPILASIYGIIHDQMVYSISPEYYTRYKFPRFGIDPHLSDRSGLLLTGWMWTWWPGLIIGLVLGTVGLIHRTPRMMKTVSESILITFAIAFSAALVGLASGGLFLPHGAASWNLPDHLLNKRDFLAVSFMHSFTRVGGVIGLAAGILYQIRQRRQLQSSGYRRMNEQGVHGQSRRAA